MWIYGNGGHAKVIRAATLGVKWSIVDDNNPNLPWLPQYERESGIIAIGDNHARQRIVDKLSKDQQYETVYDKSSVHRQPGFINDGAGTVFLAGSVVQAGCGIGDHVIINTGATVDHDCWINYFAHIAPGAHLCGNVTVGEGTLVGAGTIVTPGVQIGSWLTIPAGSVVTKDCLNEEDVAQLRRR